MPTIREAVKSYLENLELVKNARPVTVTGYRSVLRRWISPELMDADTSVLTERLCLELVGRYRGRVKRSTAQTGDAVAKLFTRYCHQKGWTATWGLADVRLPAVRRKHHPVLAEDDVQRLAAYVEPVNVEGRTDYGFRDHAIVWALYDGALRSSELSRLRVQDIIGKTPRGWATLQVESAKGERPRIVYLRDQATASLDRYLAHGRPRLADPRSPSRSLFLTRFGDPFQPWMVRKTVHRLGVRAGFEFPVVPHLLRHSMATFLARQVSPWDLQAYLGHQKLETTMHYVHLGPAGILPSLEKAADRQEAQR